MATAELEAPETTAAVESFDPGLPAADAVDAELLKDLDFGDPSKTPAPAADDKVPAADDAASAKDDASEGEPASGYDPGLVARAEEFGFTQDAYETPSQLAKLVAWADKQVAATGRQEQKPEPAATETKPADQGIDFDALGKLYEPELLAPLKHLHERNQKLEAKLTQLDGYFQQQQAEAFARTFEGLIDGVAETYGEVLGKGKTLELDPKSTEAGNRFKVIDEMTALQAGYQQLGRTIPPPDELFNRAVRSVFADQIAKNTRQAITTRLRSDKGQFVAKPSHKRTSDLPKGPERAERAVAQMLQDQGRATD